MVWLSESKLMDTYVDFMGSRPKPIRPRNVPEYQDSKDQKRNEKCSCGSGKKYKKCCGAPQHMDLTIGKGCVISFQLYHGPSREEYDKLLKLAESCKDSNFPLCLPKYELKVLEITETSYDHEEYPSYTIEVKGEIL
jgi:hypothetical protein